MITLMYIFVCRMCFQFVEEVYKDDCALVDQRKLLDKTMKGLTQDLLIAKLMIFWFKISILSSQTKP